MNIKVYCLIYIFDFNPKLTEVPLQNNPELEQVTQYLQTYRQKFYSV